MIALTDEMIEYLGENWDKLGLTPVFIFRLLERNWSPEEIDKVMSIVIGTDYKDIKMTEWINRLEEDGLLPNENDPLIDILDAIMIEYVDNMKGVK